MNENKFKRMEGGVTFPAGFRASGIHCGLRKNKNKKDLALILADKPCSAAAIYTTNKVYGAPITVTREHLKNGIAVRLSATAVMPTPAIPTAWIRQTPCARLLQSIWESMKTISLSLRLALSECLCRLNRS